MARPSKFAHVVYSTRRFEEMIDWYESVFEAKVVYQNPVFLIEYYSDRVFPRMAQMGYQAVRTERWKYIHYLELQGMDEFYDLKTDPYEMKNLIHQPVAEKALARMKQ